ncbi:MAG: hypothetical protein AB7V08_06010 [Elusimicrobiales bacterium]
MADNSNNRKKALVVSVLAFLFAGGGIFLFFIVQGANDLTGADKKSSFSYGNVARGAVNSFFRTVGFMEDDPIVEYGPGKRPLPQSVLDAKLLKAELSASAADRDLSSWGGVKSPGGSSSRAAVPKMASKAGSPVGGASGGGSKSAGNATRFGAGSGQGMTKISGAVKSAEGTTEKGTLASLQNAKAMLGDGLRSGSASTARDKWGQSFGVSASGSGKSGALAYNKTGLVNLDKIKSGEISNLKMQNAKSLKVPDVGAFQQDKDAEAKDPTLQKAKKDAEDSIKKSAAEAAAKAAAEAITKDGEDKATAPVGRSGDGDEDGGQEQGECGGMGPQTEVCSAAMEMAFEDESVSFEKLGSSDKGTIYAVKFDATDPPAHQNSNMVVAPDGTVEWTFGDYKPK